MSAHGQNTKKSKKKQAGHGLPHDKKSKQTNPIWDQSGAEKKKIDTQATVACHHELQLESNQKR